MNKPKIHNIIFDLGNTLVYFDFSYFYNGITDREKKLSSRKLQDYIIKNHMFLKLMSGRMTHKEFFRKLKKKFELKIGYNDFIYFYSDIFWENPNMKKFLDKISRLKHYKLFLLSNTDSIHIKFIDKNFPFVRTIKSRVLSYKVKMYKPQIKIYKYTLQKYKLEPAETVLIDDMKMNIEAAKRAGINAILYTSHKKFTSDFSRLIKNS